MKKKTLMSIITIGAIVFGTFIYIGCTKNNNLQENKELITEKNKEYDDFLKIAEKDKNGIYQIAITDKQLKNIYDYFKSVSKDKDEFIFDYAYVDFWIPEIDDVKEITPVLFGFGLDGKGNCFSFGLVLEENKRGLGLSMSPDGGGTPTSVTCKGRNCSSCTPSISQCSCARTADPFDTKPNPGVCDHSVTVVFTSEISDAIGGN